MRPEKKKVFNKFYYNAQYYICRYAQKTSCNMLKTNLEWRKLTLKSFW